jgi:hypothetical protein
VIMPYWARGRQDSEQVDGGRCSSQTAGVAMERAGAGLFGWIDAVSDRASLKGAARDSEGPQTDWARRPLRLPGDGGDW